MLPHPARHPPLGEECEILKKFYAEDDIKGFVLTDVAQNAALAEKIFDKSNGVVDLRKVTVEEAETKQAVEQAEVAQKLAQVEDAQKNQTESAAVPIWGMPESVPSQKPVSSSKPALGSEPVASPQPTPAPEPAASSKPTLAPEPAASSKPTLAPEPAASPKPTPAPEPAASSKPTLAPEPVAGSQPTPAPEPAPSLKPDDDEKPDPSQPGGEQPAQPVAYTVLFMNGDEEFARRTVNHGETVQSFANPPKEGETFTGWFTSDGQKWEFGTPVTGDITLAARWNVTTYTVGFDAGADVSMPTAVTVSHGGKVTEPTLTKEGYTLEGWYQDSACMQKWNFVTDTVTGDMTLYAKWNVNRYAVTFEANGGTPAPTTQTVACNGKATEPTAPTKTGYTLEGWYQDSACMQKWNFVTDIVTGDMILYAKWNVNRYAVTFEANGGTPVPTTQTVACNGKATEPTAPTKTGYTLEGWYQDSACMQKWNFITDTVTGDMTLYAKWNVNRYAVTFEANGGTPVPTTQTVACNGKATEPTAPTKTGYTLEGWYQDSACMQKWNFDTDTVTGDMTLYAKWTWSNGGKTGNLDWSITNRILTISGTGDMPNYGDEGGPWRTTGIDKVVIGPGVSSIGSKAFKNSSLQVIDISNSGVQSIGDSAFEGSALGSIAIPDSVTSIGNHAFKDCHSLTGVTIGSGVSSSNMGSIGDRAFENCDTLGPINIPEGVTSIGAAAFKGAYLASAILPKSLTSIGLEAFDTKTLTDMKYRGTQGQWNAIKYGDGNVSAQYSATCGYTG